MIEVHINLKGPLGPPSHLAHISIWTTPCGKKHEFVARTLDYSFYHHGFLLKKYSGHQNVFHTLQEVLKEVTSGGLAAGSNYITRGGF